MAVLSRACEQAFGKEKAKQSGFTLVEIIVTIALLAIFSLPMLNYFSDANRHNNAAKIKQNAVVVAQKALEELKAETVDVMTADQLIDTTSPATISQGWSLVATPAPGGDGTYAVARSCSINGGTYKVKAEITPIDEVTNDAGTTVQYKGVEQPTMNSATDVIATETSTVLIDVESYFYGVYSNYCEQHGITPVSSVTPDSIIDHMKRKIGVSLDKDPANPNNALVKVYYEYNYALGSGESYPAGINASTKFTKEVKRRSIKATELSDIYIFFIPDENSDELELDAKVDCASLGISTGQLKLYLIAQNSVSANTILPAGDTTPKRSATYSMKMPTSCTNNFNSYFSDVYTNLSANSPNEVVGGCLGGKLKMEGTSYTLVRKVDKQRVAHIKVSVYRGDSLAVSNHCLSVEGTRVQD